MNAVTKELKRIAKQHGGELKPEHVVEFAKDPSTALHSRFTWDDTEAAHQHRLWQARQVIRVNVEMIEGATDPVRVFVSLKDKRYQQGGGYETLVSVMSDADRKAQFFEEAKAELLAARQKYRRLTELEPIFAAMDRVFTPVAKRKRVPQPA